MAIGFRSELRAELLLEHLYPGGELGEAERGWRRWCRRRQAAEAAATRQEAEGHEFWWRTRSDAELRRGVAVGPFEFYRRGDGDGVAAAGELLRTIPAAATVSDAALPDAAAAGSGSGLRGIPAIFWEPAVLRATVGEVLTLRVTPANRTG